MKDLLKETTDETASKEQQKNKAQWLKAHRKVSAGNVDEISMYIKRYIAPQNGSEELSPVLVATVIPL